MELKEIKIIIPTCDKYIHLIEGLMYTINKFWDVENEFIILGYKEPKFELNKNWSFISLGLDTGPSNWSNDLLKYFKNFKDEYFINIIDDTLMSRKSDTEKIKIVLKYMISNKTIKKCFLHGSLSDGNVGLLGDIKLTPIEELDYQFYDVNQTANYRSSLQSAIWSTDYFLNILKPNLTPWSFELQDIKNDNFRILTTVDNHPTMYSHLYRIGGQLIPNWYESVFENTKLSDDDIDLLKNILKL